MPATEHTPQTAASDVDLPARVLVAEDEHLVATSLRDMLGELGIRVVGPAANGREALEFARSDEPQMALIDVRMPVMDGLEAASVLFGQMGIPVVIISAFTDDPYIRDGARLGVFGYAVKPMTREELRVNLAVAWSKFREHQSLLEEVQELKTNLSNRKTIEKAKGLLMRRLGLDEEAAMRRLQKQARNSRIKLVDLAQAILDADQMLDPSSLTSEQQSELKGTGRSRGLRKESTLQSTEKQEKQEKQEKTQEKHGDTQRP